ncbi:MAG: hypothetical protein U0514_00590 [Candidatus Andersenbacteria bacterium]
MNLELSELDSPHVDKLMRTVEQATTASLRAVRAEQAEAMGISSAEAHAVGYDYDYDGLVRRLEAQVPARSAPLEPAAHQPQTVWV